jgi:nucleoside-diphosphate-sugar epimerase
VSAAARIGGRHTVLTRDVGLVVSSRMLVDTSKAVRDLGYRPVPLELLVRDEARWLRDNGQLGQRARLLWSR